MKNKIINLIFSFILIFSITKIYSQTVVPSDRVTSGLNVREEPNTHSNIIGYLNIGQSADLIESALCPIFK